MYLWAKHNVKQFYQLLYSMTDFTKEFEYSNAALLKEEMWEWFHPTEMEK